MSSLSPPVLLSIQPEHARRIYSGKKRAELRKSFAKKARLVFLYETAPVSAVTGAFLAAEVTKTSIDAAVEIAKKGGVSSTRTRKYFGSREKGWVVEIANAIKFSSPIPLDDLREESHQFLPPQVFTYLQRTESLTQLLLSRFLAQISSEIRLRKLPKKKYSLLAGLIRSDVRPFYEDIDEDFILQVLEEKRSAAAAFSTVHKHLLEVVWRNQAIGYSVLTEKEHGAWKSGPTILLPEFRGLTFGVAMRTAMERYCRAQGGSSIYCTCSDQRAEVVSYLLNSGMKIQARLVGHLARDRDELVFAKRIVGNRRAAGSLAKRTSFRAVRSKVKVRRVQADDAAAARVISYFIGKMSGWYFRPRRGLGSGIKNGLKAYESGTKDYSAKGRILYASLAPNGAIRGALLATMKRSEMIKMNFVASTDNEALAGALLRRALRDLKLHRRVYLTVAANKAQTIQAIDSQGFVLEGILQDPFSTGINHLCFGRLSGSRGVRAKNEA